MTSLKGISFYTQKKFIKKYLKQYASMHSKNTFHNTEQSVLGITISSNIKAPGNG